MSNPNQRKNQNGRNNKPIKCKQYEQGNELGQLRSYKGNQRVRDETSGKCQTEGTVETRTGRTGEEAERHVLGG